MHSAENVARIELQRAPGAGSRLPTLGRIVLYRQPASEQPVNGGSVHPAVITRVHSDELVNLTVFFDAAPPAPRTSILSKAAAGGDMSGSPFWDWPPVA